MSQLELAIPDLLGGKGAESLGDAKFVGVLRLRDCNKRNRCAQGDSMNVAGLLLQEMHVASRRTDAGE